MHYNTQENYDITNAFPIVASTWCMCMYEGQIHTKNIPHKREITHRSSQRMSIVKQSIFH